MFFEAVSESKKFLLLLFSLLYERDVTILRDTFVGIVKKVFKKKSTHLTLQVKTRN
jgi:hypothetical protein